MQNQFINYKQRTISLISYYKYQFQNLFIYSTLLFFIGVLFPIFSELDLFTSGILKMIVNSINVFVSLITNLIMNY